MNAITVRLHIFSVQGKYLINDIPKVYFLSVEINSNVSGLS